MRSKQTRHKKSNKKRLHRKSGRTRLLVYLFFAVIVAGFLLFRTPPAERQPGPEASASERLRALPYLSWAPAKNASRTGVTRFDRTKSLSGVNLYKSGDMTEAYLMDMQGNILHTWAAKTEKDDTWSNIELAGHGELIAFVNYERLVRLDWNSNVLWTSDNLGFHHDLFLAKNRDIYALTRKIEYIPELTIFRLTANDYITILDESGKQKRSLSIAGLLLDSGIPVIQHDTEADYPRSTKPKQFIARLESSDETNGLVLSFFLPALKKIEYYYEKISRPKDYLHSNTIHVIENAQTGDTRDLFAQGNVLVCIRNQNLVAIVDMEKEEIIWSWGTEDLQHPHDPVILDNGNMLIFDNGIKRGYSRIIELDPVKKEIVREYTSTPREEFFSETRGSNQKLPNGNILIADSRNGRAFEITGDGEIVWEFYNPEIKRDGKNSQRATIFRMRRLLNPETLPPAL